MARNYYWHDELVKRDGKIYIRSEYTQGSQPVRTIMYWPVSHANAVIGEVFPLPARRADSGLYNVRREPDLNKADCGYDAHFSVYLPEGGNTKAEIVENVDYPCPRVRKGIETRYHNGSWQKYSKREGWIAA